jgi:hypothetical protein
VKVIIGLVIAFVLVLLAGAAMALVLTKDDDTTDTDSINNSLQSEYESVGDPTSTDESILEQFATQNSVQLASLSDFEDSNLSGYISINDFGNYANISTVKPSMLLDFGIKSQDGCYSQPADDAVASLEQEFKYNEYDTTKVSAYSGGFGCNRGFVATQGSEQCFGIYSFKQKDNERDYRSIVHAGCVDTNDYTNEISDYNDYVEFIANTDPRGGGFTELLAYDLKVSKSNDGEYSRLSYSLPSGQVYGYKADGGVWKQVQLGADGYNISCDIGGELAIIFEGFTCDSYDSGRIL